MGSGKKRDAKKYVNKFEELERVLSIDPWNLFRRVSTAWTGWTVLGLISPLTFSSDFLSHSLGQIGILGAFVTAAILLFWWNEGVAPIIRALEIIGRIFSDTVPKGLVKKGLSKEGLRKRLREINDNELDRLNTVLDMEVPLRAARDLSKRAFLLFAGQLILWLITLAVLGLAEGYFWGIISAVTVLTGAAFYTIASASAIVNKICDKLSQTRDLLDIDKPNKETVNDTEVENFDSFELTEAGLSLLKSIGRVLPNANIANTTVNRLGAAWCFGTLLACIIAVFSDMSYVSISAGLVSCSCGMILVKNIFISMKLAKGINRSCSEFHRTVEPYNNLSLSKAAWTVSRTSHILLEGAKASFRSVDLIAAGTLLAAPIWLTSGVSEAYLATARFALTVPLLFTLRAFVVECPHDLAQTRCAEVKQRLGRNHLDLENQQDSERLVAESVNVASQVG